MSDKLRIKAVRDAMGTQLFVCFVPGQEHYGVGLDRCAAYFDWGMKAGLNAMFHQWIQTPREAVH